MSAPMKVKCRFTEKVENSSDSSSGSDNEENERLKEAVIGMYLTSDKILDWSLASLGLMTFDLALGQTKGVMY